MPLDFTRFFQSAFKDERQPYDYQNRLATSPCESRLISIPTGLGKTAAVILSWLWNRVGHPDADHRNQWPRRLVYCLPMRTLVEQTRDEAKDWITKLAQHFPGKPPRVVILMGGEEPEDDERNWDLYPEEDAILIGTQDMLLSRALNRGYGMSRYRWPMHFGLLNNDCLWVLDETQLMGVGVETSAQLDGLRHLAQWLRHSPAPTWWMSATLEDRRLATVDHPLPPGGWPRLALGDADRVLPRVKARLESVKHLHRSPVELAKATKDTYAKTLAQHILEKHVPGHLTLVILNRVPRVQDIYAALQKAGRKDNLGLVHSRFRSPDRKVHQDLLIEGEGDRIVIATQAVEAGVDVSARVLITELAPWSSLVQRFGRCNRGGEFNADGADIHWINLAYEDDKETAPYLASELNDARAELEKLGGTSVGPEALKDIVVTPPAVIRPVIRKKDLLDLFDTTPDIAGHDLDISRYIREGEDNDVQVFWRDLSASDFRPTAETKDAARPELCRVAVYQFQAFLDKLKKAGDGRQAYVWDGLRDEWTPATRARPGAIYLLDHRAGGYQTQVGWIGTPAVMKKADQWVNPVALQADIVPDGNQRDPLSLIGTALSLEAHTFHVEQETQSIVGTLDLPTVYCTALLTAARWHDVGKALMEFQALLRHAAGEGTIEGLLAKSGKKSSSKGPDWPLWRKHYRHELASALAWLVHHDGTESADLVAYIIAAHHGKVRLSIRSLPEEHPPHDRSSELMARGIVNGDKLPALTLGNLTIPQTTLSLRLMQMGTDEKGRPSWLARMIALRDEMGPFTLAFVETLLRSADMRASAKEAQTSIAAP
jgi:CRISPR-associated endonuclease/helicase Cas3